MGGCNIDCIPAMCRVLRALEMFTEGGFNCPGDSRRGLVLQDPGCGVSGSNHVGKNQSSDSSTGGGAVILLFTHSS